MDNVEKIYEEQFTSIVNLIKSLWVKVNINRWLFEIPINEILQEEKNQFPCTVWGWVIWYLWHINNKTRNGLYFKSAWIRNVLEEAERKIEKRQIFYYVFIRKIKKFTSNSAQVEISDWEITIKGKKYKITKEIQDDIVDFIFKKTR